MIQIYKITNILLNKSYVGQTRKDLRERFTSHCSQSNYNFSPLKKDIGKYGKTNFILTKLYDVVDYHEASQIEDDFILSENTLSPYGYNQRLNSEKDTK